MYTLSFNGRYLEIKYPNETIPKTMFVQRYEQKTNGIKFIGNNGYEESLNYGDCSTDGNTAFADLATMLTFVKAGIGSFTTGAATEVTLQQVRDAIKAQIDLSTSIWTDNTGTYYVRRDLVNEGTGVITIAWTLVDGTTSSGPGTGAKPLANADKKVTQELFEAIATATGYTSGDLLARLLVLDSNLSSPTVTTIWYNLSTNATISAPSYANITRANEIITAALAAGENFVGAVGGKSKNVSIAVPTTANTYAAGKVIGGVLTIANASRLSGKETLLQSLHIKDTSNGKGAFSILIFDSDPSSGATVSDNSTFAYGSSAYAKQIGLISIAASDYKTFDSKASAPITGLGRVYTPNGSANLYAVIVAESSVTLTANCLTIIAGFLQD